MLTDQELLNLAPREGVEADNNVFEDGCSTPPVSPRPPPGIILTVEGSPEIIDVGERHRSTTRSSRRSRRASSSHHRSPSGSRMSSARQQQPQQNGHRLRDPSYLSGSGVSRSQSMRTARRPQSVDPTHRFRHRIASIPNDMTLPSDGLSGQRLASNQSLPLPDDEDVMRLRNFAITSKGIVNRGDSFRSKSRSSHSVVSMGVVGQVPLTPSHQKDDSVVDYATVCTEKEAPTIDGGIQTMEVEGASAAPDVPKTNKFRVLVVGPGDVGKTALINQFMTSEYMCAYENSQDDENERTVPVILNGSESELVFSEHQFTGDSTVNFCELFNPDAYLVVYSVTTKRTLQTAKEALRLIHKWDDVHSKALILVGNKTDLARHRVLSTDDGRSLAIEEGSKFIETSAGINHQIDELLVGILSQIRLKQSSMDKALQKRESVSLGSSSRTKMRGGKCSGCAGCKAKGILKRILKKACSRSKSCDNLHVL